MVSSVFPYAGNASIFVRSRERGGGCGGIASRGLQLDRPALSLCSAFFLSPVSSGTPLVHRSFLTDGVQGWRVVDLDAARRRRAASSGDGRLPAAAAAPDAARPAQPSITPAARRTVDLYDAESPSRPATREYFKLK